MTAWMKLVMETKRKHPNFSLGQAMKEAKKHYHPAKTAKSGGFLQKVGGRRRRTARGGSLYGFGEGDGGLAGGAGRMKTMDGGRRRRSTKKGGRRHRRRTHRGGVSPPGGEPARPARPPPIAIPPPGNVRAESGAAAPRA
jgi:hypothetical protein